MYTYIVIFTDNIKNIYIYKRIYIYVCRHLYHWVTSPGKKALVERLSLGYLPRRDSTRAPFIPALRSFVSLDA